VYTLSPSQANTRYNAQALTTPFTLRLYDFANDVIFPKSLAHKMRDAERLPNFARWLDTCMAHESVTYVYHREQLLKGVEARLGEAKAKYADKD
jgi:glutathione S-transferase